MREHLFPPASDIAVESAVCLTFGTLMSLSLGRGPARVGRGSSSSSTSSLDSAVLFFVAFNKRHNKMATSTRRMKDKAAKPTIADLRLVSSSATKTKNSKIWNWNYKRR